MIIVIVKILDDTAEKNLNEMCQKKNSCKTAFGDFPDKKSESQFPWMEVRCS